MRSLKEGFAAFLVAHSRIILIIFIILALACGALIPYVNVNRDMTKYLPEDSSMRQGLDLMKAEFGEEDSSTLLVMFGDLTNAKDKGAIRMELEAMPYVDSVDYEAQGKDAADYNRGRYTLYRINCDTDQYSDEAAQLWNAVQEKYGETHEIYLGGTVDSANHNGLPLWIALAAVGLILLILLIMANSWIEPLAFLITIGIAVLINMGTYVFFPSISKTTFGIVAILQLALSIDYSIMLLNRYRQQRRITEDKRQAMREALSLSFGAITGSSLTTFAGLLALLFMSFGIGADIGLALAKGVLISLLCIFTVLPTLLLAFDGLMIRTAKKTIPSDLPRLSRGMRRLRVPLTLLFALIFAGSFILRNDAGFSYAQYGSGDAIEQVFGADNTIVMMYNVKDAKPAGALAERLEDQDEINSAVCYESTLGKDRTAKQMKDFIDDMKEEGDEAGDQTGNLKGNHEGDIDTADMDLSLPMMRLLYYDYFVGDPDLTLTLPGFVSYLRDDVMEDPDFEDVVDDEARSHIDDLAKFTDTGQLTAGKGAAGLASFFGMKKADAKQLLLYYQIKKSNRDAGRMKLSSFVRFLLDDVARDSEYRSMFPAGSLNQLKQMRVYTSKKKMTRKRTWRSAARILGMDPNQMRLVYIYDLLEEQAKAAQQAAEQNQGTQPGVEQPGTDQPASDQPGGTTPTVPDQNVPGQDPTSGSTDRQTGSTEQTGTDQPGDTAPTTPDQYAPGQDPSAGSTDGQNGSTEQTAPGQDPAVYVMTIMDLAEVFKAMSEDPVLASRFDPEQTGQLIAGLTQIGQMDPRPYDMNSMAAALAGYGIPMDIQGLSLAYAYRQVSESPKDFTHSVKHVLHFMLSNKDIRSSMSKKQKKQLKTLRRIVDCAVSGKALTARAMGKLLGMKPKDVRSLYLLHTYRHGNTGSWKLSPQQFIHFLINDILTDASLKNRIGDDADDLKLAGRLIDSAVAGTSFTYQELADLLKGSDNEFDAEDICILYELYGSEHEYDNSWKMDLMQLVTHLDDQVANRPAFASAMDDEQIEDVHEMREDMDEAADLLQGEEYGRMMISADLPEDSDETRAFMDDLTNVTGQTFQEPTYLIGTTPMAYETSKTFHRELNQLTILTAIFIFLIVLLTFRRLVTPLILVLLIQCAVFMTMGVLYFLNVDMNYLALLIVQSIMMGATIDYAIIFTSYYTENRSLLKPTEAIRAAYRGSLQTILTSAIILIAAVGVLSFAFEEPATRQICRILSLGCLIATTLVIFILPGLLSCLDRFIAPKKSPTE